WRFPKGQIEGRCGEVSRIYFNNITALSENGCFVGGDVPGKVKDIYFNNVRVNLSPNTQHPSPNTQHQKYLAYGGDFGDTPNDGQFVMNGIIFGDLQPKPQYFDVKKVYQNIKIDWDCACRDGVNIVNKNYFTDLSNLDCHFKVLADGEVVKEGTIDIDSIAPRTVEFVEIPELKNFDPKDGREYFVNFEFRLKRDMPWAKAGYVQADEQLGLRIPKDASVMMVNGKIDVTEANGLLRLSGNGFDVAFDRADGSIRSLSYGGRKVFEDGCGPRLDAFRAWVNNDNWAYQNWYANGLHNLKHKNVTPTGYFLENNSNGSISVAFEIESQAPNGAKLEGSDRNWKRLTEFTDKPFGKDDFKFHQNLIYTIYPDGSVEANVAITSNNPQLVLPRLGYVMKTPSAMENFRYYGRGPIDNYPDRKSSQFIGIYSNKVADEFENFPKPQDMANHQDTRWCSLTDNNGAGALFIGREPMSVSVLPWSAQELAMANHPHELPASSGNWLHLDMAITGLGGNSCGQAPPLEPDRVKASAHRFSFMILPLNKATTRRLRFVGVSPIQFKRDANGLVTIEWERQPEVYYKIIPPNSTAKQISAIKPMRYVGPFNLRNGGTVVACPKIDEKGNFAASSPIFQQTFDEIFDHIPVTVTFASSVESGEGDAEHLVDGNPNTYWHTMWSVTVANYPHWIDFDCGTQKRLKGFVYLPRQDSSNGHIKQY
ncbi:MAG: DUF4981 domain-containing protein, partial [Prevotella sp.]|nr:DUF4981 domain-containing protein [Prevotella sp.]